MDLASRATSQQGATHAIASQWIRAWRDWWAQAITNAKDRNARGWYFGAALGLCYQAITLVTIWLDGDSLANRVVTTILLVPLFAGFAFIPPLVWRTRLRDRLVAFAIYGAYSLIFFPLIGSSTMWLWVLVGVVAVVIFEEVKVVAPIIAVLTAVPLIYGVATGFQSSASFSAIVTFSVASMMFGMNQQIRAVRQLKEAQSEIARLAVIEERGRFSRDMHDVLGHSLTVVTVKSELARRLVKRDPEAAENEIADIERLSRSALVDLRAAVSGYREISLSTELAVAQASLSSAKITAHLPSNGEMVDPQFRELFGWVLREGVTNVIRHSGAAGCWVTVTARSLRIEDDGHGCRDAAGPRAIPAGRGDSSGAAVARDGGSSVVGGNGLRGLIQRAGEFGASIAYGSRDGGGFFLEVCETEE